MKRRKPSDSIVSVLDKLEKFEGTYGLGLGDTVFYKGRPGRVTAINLLSEPQTIVLDFGTERINVESLVLDGGGEYVCPSQGVDSE